MTSSVDVDQTHSAFSDPSKEPITSRPAKMKDAKVTQRLAGGAGGGPAGRGRRKRARRGSKSANLTDTMAGHKAGQRRARTIFLCHRHLSATLPQLRLTTTWMNLPSSTMSEDHCVPAEGAYISFQLEHPPTSTLSVLVDDLEVPFYGSPKQYVGYIHEVCRAPLRLSIN